MSKGSRIVGGLLVGAIAGTLLGVLFAPRSGKETRKLIKKKVQNLKDQAVEVKDKIVKTEDK
jgi:gas vesicle protein